MSHVNLLVVTGAHDRRAIARLNGWVRRADGLDRDERFERLDTGEAGGWKVMTCEVWAMAAKHFPCERLSLMFPTFGWRLPELALLVIDRGPGVPIEVQRAVAGEAPNPVGWETGGG